MPRPAKRATTWDRHPLFDALRSRRSRRFMLGASLPDGPLPYASAEAPRPLTEQEQALLVFAAVGVTGPALNDMGLGTGQGGTMMAGLTGRTISSLDAIQAAALIVTSEDGTWLARRGADMSPKDVVDLIDLADRGDYLAAYRRQRVPIAAGRIAPPVDPPVNLPLNRWALYGPGTTYFLPVVDLTLPYINAALELLNEENAFYPVDERARFAPAGVGRFGKRKGGHLDDSGARSGPIRDIDLSMVEFVTVEVGMMLQNLGLACDALGLGGYPNYAGQETAWFERLGFRMGELPLSRYIGADRFVRAALRLQRQDDLVRFPLGLETADGEVLLRAYCPPYFPSMRAAVEAVVERKLGDHGIYRAQARTVSGWSDPAGVSAGIPPISDAAIEATVAFCEYVYQRYGRFPAHVPPFHATVGFQAGHLDVGFYARHYRPDAVTERHRAHFGSALHA